MTLLDLKWDPVSLGFQLDEFAEPLLVTGEGALTQSIQLALMDSPLARLFFGAEPEEAELIATQLMFSLEMSHPEIRVGSIKHQLQGSKLDLRLELSYDSGKSLTLYFEDLLYAAQGS
ncbi:MAG: hypothetical protein A2600_08875 [Candidatus Lambdaproteobacteria bacterium RIFOXYD1_FULL_56_27]|uniref:Uncharacterized protein n=1 Tax=Candidatus Lambdaproteobacteria bacterium RIFOXYD2_FULL_56_26 TaxID=1817773 RepID=A0A1F6GZ52_9PROT|nr:MAG: hypothetical protein A2426_10295 [Candidatus Lambdaproteobacteria bacterium RIFOXYC1_FULL_56_13]OGH03352.1 MAG: hypothetical protein A2557_02390 [Candidatus Lambdaproteobacteria bacterium RIFOXYD2_FULL_56_26]OGH06643.1 MAG: hypothetical protein A2600_08875 [Candidatus Lambdaproteobacteria bacterium RIFOXYD1_FULL_56_27]